MSTRQEDDTCWRGGPAAAAGAETDTGRLLNATGANSNSKDADDQQRCGGRPSPLRHAGSTSGRQDQELSRGMTLSADADVGSKQCVGGAGASAGAAAANTNNKQQPGRPDAASAGGAAHHSASDHHQQRDVTGPTAAAGGRSSSAFAAASVFPECSTSAGSDASSLLRQPRGVEAMMGGGQQRRSASGALLSPSGLSDHSCGLGGFERAASGASTHRALLGNTSPILVDSPASAACGGGGLPAAASGLLDVAEQQQQQQQSPLAAGAGSVSDPMDEDVPAAAAAAASQQQQQDLATTTTAARRAGAGIQRPTVVIPSPEVSAYYHPDVMQPMHSPPPSSHTQATTPYSGGTITIDQLDLDAVDGITPDACDPYGLSTSSSPTISSAGGGAAGGGGGAGGQGGRGGSSLAAMSLRSSRDLRRAAFMNLLSPGLQAVAPSPHLITAAGGGNSNSNSPRGGGSDISITPEGAVPHFLPSPAMFTGPTRSRALPQQGSSNSLHSVGSASAEQQTQQQFGAHGGATDSPSETMTLLQSLRMSRGSTPSPAPYSASPARPRSATATATPRSVLAGGSRGSSAAASPVPPPTHGAAAALLAGSVLASPRTPHSPLSVVLSPRPNSARVLSGHGTPLPGPLFGSGFNPMGAAAATSAIAAGTDTGAEGAAAAAPASGGTSPGTSSVAAPGSTSSSCGTGSAVAPAGPPFASAAAAGAAAAAGGGGTRRWVTSPLSTPGGPSCDISLPQVPPGSQQQQQHQADGQPLSNMQQLLRQQVMQHDTRFGPHGGSPLSPSHHHTTQLPPRGDVLLSPTCPTPLVPPVLVGTPASAPDAAANNSSSNRQLADATTAAAAAGAAPAAHAGAAHGVRPVGGVGHLSIHEWLDHHSWRLQYEVPQGLRDAADVREAAAHTQLQQHHQTQQQQQVQQQQQPRSRPPSSSRSSSQRNSLTNLDSPGSGLHAAGVHGLSRFQLGVPQQQQQLPPPAIDHLLQEQQHQEDQQQQSFGLLLSSAQQELSVSAGGAGSGHVSPTSCSSSISGTTGSGGLEHVSATAVGATARAYLEQLPGWQGRQQAQQQVVLVQGPSHINSQQGGGDSDAEHPAVTLLRSSFPSSEAPPPSSSVAASASAHAVVGSTNSVVSPAALQPLPAAAAAAAAAAPAWRHLHSPLMSPDTAGQQQQQQHPDQDRDVLPGIAELLTRRHEQPGQHVPREQQRGGRSQPAGDQQQARTAAPACSASLPAPAYDMLAAGQRWDDSIAATRDADAADAAAANSFRFGYDDSPDAGMLPDSSRGQMAAAAAAAERSSPVAAAAATAKVRRQHRAKGMNSRRSTSFGGSSSNAALARLLQDEGFLGRVLAELPGVDPSSDSVREAVAELQMALAADGSCTSPAHQHHNV